MAEPFPGEGRGPVADRLAAAPSPGKKVAILLSGRGSNMQALVAASQAPACPYAVVLVASDNPDAPGLGWAAAHGLATFAASPRGRPRAEYEAEIEAALRAAGTEVIALAGYMRLLSPAFVAAWRGRILNIHPSLLPAYRGLDTHARAIAAGDAHAGCTVHLVTDELDAGEILGQAIVPILPGDTPQVLAERVLAEEHRLYPDILARFARRMTDTPLDRIRTSALALPETEERVSHGQPTFFVAGKQFAQVRENHHGDGLHVVCVRTAGPDEQAMLIEAAPETYRRPAYLGPAGWVSVDLADPDWPLIEDRIARSWELAAPRRLLEAGGR